jgi:hypothetical protein
MSVTNQAIYDRFILSHPVPIPGCHLELHGNGFHVARTVEKEHAYRALLGKSEENNPHRGQKNRWENIILLKVFFQQDGRTWTGLTSLMPGTIGVLVISFQWSNSPFWARVTSLSRFTITLRHTTVERQPLGQPNQIAVFV